MGAFIMGFPIPTPTHARLSRRGAALALTMAVSVPVFLAGAAHVHEDVALIVEIERLHRVLTLLRQAVDHNGDLARGLELPRRHLVAQDRLVRQCRSPNQASSIGRPDSTASPISA